MQEDVYSVMRVDCLLFLLNSQFIYELFHIDREGKAINVSMVPGDMVLYESGSLLHGVS